MAEEWRDIHGKDDKFILQISEGNNESNPVDFVTTFPTARELSDMSAANETRLLYVASFHILAGSLTFQAYPWVTPTRCGPKYQSPAQTNK